MTKMDVNDEVASTQAIVMLIIITHTDWLDNCCLSDNSMHT